jgi:coenzyme F420-0:L-glutamate ligase/coenzyme F420-1:gamma-L-glutamate ligase
MGSLPGRESDESRGLRVEVIGITGLPEVKPGDDLAELIVGTAERNGIGIMDMDVVVVAHKIVSKAEGRLVPLSSVVPSQFAVNLAQVVGKSPEDVEVILRESRAIVRCRRGILITENMAGIVMANSGVDRSNVQEGYALLLPSDPDASARSLREGIRRLTGRNVAVVISDTMGRPIRNGQVDVAIGISGIAPFRDYRGLRDPFGRELRVTSIAHVDEIASAAELVMGKLRRVPVAIVRGYPYDVSDEGSSGLNMSEDQDMFR